VDAGKGALAGALLKQALQQRVFGFELLPAPFVVAHMQMGLMLTRLGAGLAKGERLPVYLTNALTGWEHPAEPKKEAVLQQLSDERVAADAIKHQKPILVILGNPPYSGYAGISNMKEERSLTTAYREPIAVRRPEGQGLNDLYVRFFRMAERKIAEWSQEGLVCFISNYSWLSGLSHSVMRETLLTRFDKVYIDNLHGDRIISEYAPDGRTSETIFAISGQSQGIKIGTAITTLCKRRLAPDAPAKLYYRDFTDAKADERRNALLAASEDDTQNTYKEIQPILELGLPFRPMEVSEAYLSWPTLEEIFPMSYPGVKTSRDSFLVDIDRARLEGRLQRYFDPAISHGDLKAQYPEIMTGVARFNPEAVRDVLRKRGMKSEGLVRYAYRPMDVRWLYWEGETKLLDEKRPEYMPQVFEGNHTFVIPQRARRDWSPPLSSPALTDLNSMDGGAIAFPMLLREHHEDGALYAADERPNLSEAALEWLATLEKEEGNHRCTPMHTDEKQVIRVHPCASVVDSSLAFSSVEPTDLFFHALAILHAPGYRAENAGALRMDWPRIPWPTSGAFLASSATLGRRVAALLDVEQAVPGVTTGKVRADLKTVSSLATVGDKPLNLRQDLEITAGWGIRGQGGITMPSEGRREGDRVFLNDRAYWDGIPDAVWHYNLGGYQVLKKWLSYRESRLLGRSLTIDEADHFTTMARRIAALLALGPELDDNYRQR